MGQSGERGGELERLPEERRMTKKVDKLSTRRGGKEG